MTKIVIDKNGTESVAIRDLSSVATPTITNWCKQYGLTLIKRDGLVTSGYMRPSSTKKINHITLSSINEALENAERVYANNLKVNVKWSIAKIKLIKNELLDIMKINKDINIVDKNDIKKLRV